MKVIPNEKLLDPMKTNRKCFHKTYISENVSKNFFFQKTSIATKIGDGSSPAQVEENEF